MLNKVSITRSLVMAVLAIVLVYAGLSAPKLAQASGSGYLYFKVYVCKLSQPSNCKYESAWQGFLPQGHYIQPAGSGPVRYYDIYVLGGFTSYITYKEYTVDGTWGSYSFWRTRTCSPAALCTLLDVL
jgi:hypothetical protein